MKTATTRQVHEDFKTIISWVNDGDCVEITNRGKPIAVISPPSRKLPKAKKRPDFRARMKRIFGDRVFPGPNAIIADRESRDF